MPLQALPTREGSHEEAESGGVYSQQSGVERCEDSAAAYSQIQRGGGRERREDSSSTYSRLQHAARRRGGGAAGGANSHDADDSTYSQLQGSAVRRGVRVVAPKSGGLEGDYAEAYQRGPTTALAGKVLSPQQSEQIRAISQGYVSADNGQLYAQVDKKGTRKKDDACHMPEADSLVECLYSQVDKTKKKKGSQAK